MDAPATGSLSTPLSASDLLVLKGVTESPLISAPDLLVIGAELTGLATAAMAAEKGWKVQVLSDCPLTETNSSRLPGLIWPSSLAGKSSEAEREFAFYCRDLWSRLTVRPGMEFEWKVPGIVALGGPTGIPGWSDRLIELQADGWSIQGVDAEQLAGLLPGWKQTSDQGLFFPADGQINPLLASISFARNILGRKSSVRVGVSSDLKFSTEEGKISAVETSLGPTHPKRILFNTGKLPQGLPTETLPTAQTTEQTLLRGFVSLAEPICTKPVVANHTTIVPRKGGCELFRVVDSNSGDAASLLQQSWNETVSRWTAPAVGEVAAVSQITRTISASSLSLLEQLTGITNVWWFLPEANDSLLSVGLAKHLVEWLESGDCPEALGFLKG